MLPSFYILESLAVAECKYPSHVQQANKMHFSNLVKRFLETYKFNRKLFNELDKGEAYGNE